MTRSPRHRLEDIAAAIAAIDHAQGLAQRRPEDEDLARVVLAAVQFHVFTIGEAVKSLPPDVRSRRPDVPWSDIARMRDLIGHHYDKVDAEIVRVTIDAPLERLRGACEDLLAASAGSSRPDGKTISAAAKGDAERGTTRT